MQAAHPGRGHRAGREGQGRGPGAGHRRCTATRPSSSPARWSWAGCRTSSPRCAPATTRSPTSPAGYTVAEAEAARRADRAGLPGRGPRVDEAAAGRHDRLPRAGRAGLRVRHQHPQGMSRRGHARRGGHEHPRLRRRLHPAALHRWAAARSAGPACRARRATWRGSTTWCWRCSRTTRRRCKWINLARADLPIEGAAGPGLLPGLRRAQGVWPGGQPADPRRRGRRARSASRATTWIPAPSSTRPSSRRRCWTAAT